MALWAVELSVVTGLLTVTPPTKTSALEQLILVPVVRAVDRVDREQWFFALPLNIK
jgi:hypothetical protein